MNSCLFNINDEWWFWVGDAKLHVYVLIAHTRVAIQSNGVNGELEYSHNHQLTDSSGAVVALFPGSCAWAWEPGNEARAVGTYRKACTLWLVYYALTGWFLCLLALPSPPFITLVLCLACVFSIREREVWLGRRLSSHQYIHTAGLVSSTTQCSRLNLLCAWTTTLLHNCSSCWLWHMQCACKMKGTCVYMCVQWHGIDKMLHSRHA